MSEGKKFDNGKLRFDLFGPQALEATAAVLTHGAEKYGDSNWKDVEPFEHRYFAAIQRHLWAYRRGETTDPDSELAHLAHVAAGALIMLAMDLGDLAYLPGGEPATEEPTDEPEPEPEPEPPMTWRHIIEGRRTLTLPARHDLSDLEAVCVRTAAASLARVYSFVHVDTNAPLTATFRGQDAAYFHVLLDRLDEPVPWELVGPPDSASAFKWSDVTGDYRGFILPPGKAVAPEDFPEVRNTVEPAPVPRFFKWDGVTGGRHVFVSDEVALVVSTEAAQGKELPRFLWPTKSR
jgi:hypothetical protein